MEQLVEGFALSGLENRHELPHRNLLDLPNEILITIMEYLPVSSICKLRQTCSTLYQISHTRAIMKKLNFVMKNESDMKNLFDLLNETELRCINLKFVNLEISQMKKILVTLLNSHGSKIDSITMERCSVPYEMLNIIMNHCCCLKKLIFNFSMMYNSESQINSRHTNNTNKTLKVLKFQKFLINTDTEDLMFSLLSFYPEIETFTFCEKYYGDNSNMAQFLTNKISCSNKLIKNLKLDLQYDNCWMALLESNIRLQELNKLKICCSRKNDFTLKNLQTLLRCSPQLRTLKLLCTHSEIKFDHFADTINKYGNGLKLLSYEGHINRTNTEDPLYTKERCASLKCLKIKKFILGPGGRVGFNFVENGCLTHMSLHEVSFNFTSDLLKLISVSQNSLISLKLYINDDLINDDPEGYPIPHLNIQLEKLEKLKIQLRDFSMRLIDRKSTFITILLNDFNFPRLKVLSLTSNNSIIVEREDLPKIITGCPNLKKLRLFCRSKERTNMMKICEKLKSLEKLHVIEKSSDVRYYFNDLSYLHWLRWPN